MPDSVAPIATGDIQVDRAVAGVGRLFVVATIGMLLVVVTVLGAVIYAREMIDERAINAERARAERALSLAGPGIPDAERIGHDYVLRGARIVQPADLTNGEAVTAIPGVSAFVFAWTPERFGTDLFFQIAPLRLGVTGLFLAGVVAVLWQMLRIARKLDDARAREAERARRDPLTGLGNRAVFEQRLASGFDHDQPVGLLYLDLDDFKAINDRLGHPAGDAVLQEVARRFGGLVRADLDVYRIGGDEFAMLVTGAASLADLEAIARAAAGSIAEPVDTGRGRVNVGVTIGIAQREVSRTASELVAAADAALYRAKASGKVLDSAIPHAA